MPLPEGRKPDAIKVPAGRSAGLARLDMLQGFNKEFGPVLGCTRVRSSHNGGFRLLYAHVEGAPEETLLFRKDHPRHPEERHEWIDRGDGVEYGYLKPDGDAGGPADA